MNKDQPKPNVDQRQKQASAWIAAVFSVFSLVFLAYSIYIVVAVQNGRFDISDKILMPLTALMLAVSFFSYILIRLNRQVLAAGLLFVMITLVPSVITVLVLKGFIVTAVAYIVLMGSILIGLALPRASRRLAFLAALFTILLTIGIDLWDPPFRVPTAIGGFTNIVIVLAVISLFAFSIRQAWSGNIRVRLIVSLISLSVVAVAIVATVVTITVRSSVQSQTEAYFQEISQTQLSTINNFFLEKVSTLYSFALSDVINEQVILRNNSYRGSDARILAGIEALDAQWRAAPDFDPLILNIVSRDENVNPVASQLHNFSDQFEDHVEVFVTDRYGATVGATDRLSDYFQADEDWWQAAWNDGKGALYISDPEYDESANVSALLVALPIYNQETGELIGILRSTIIVESLYTVLEQIQPGETGYSMLFDRSGNVLMNPRAEQPGTSDLSVEAIKHIITESNTEFESDLSEVQAMGRNSDVVTNLNGDEIFVGYNTLRPLKISGRVFFDDIGSSAGIEQFCVDGNVDIAQSSRAIRDSEIAACRSIGRTPIAFPVAVDALVVFTSTENNFLTEVTKDELAQIFSTAENWSDVRPEWPDQPIQRIVPASVHGTYGYFIESIFDNSEAPLLNAANLTLTADLDLMIQDVLRNPYAIGFVGYSRYQSNAAALRGLSIDGIAPEREAVESFEYPLARQLYLYSDVNIMQEKPQVAAFINYFLTHTNEAAEPTGYFPLNQDALNQSKTSWLDAMDGAFGEPSEVDGDIVLPVFNPNDYPGDVVSSGSATVFRLEDAIVKRYQDEITGRVFLSEQAENILDTVNLLGWTIAVRQDSTEAFAAVNVVTRNSILVSLVVVFFAFLVALVLAQTFVRPISQLTNDARQLAEGNLSVRSQVKTNDEIGILASTFNSMTTQLQETLQGLEQRVADRTKALTTSAEVSRRLSTILDLDQLVTEVVEQVKNSFNYYHAHIYLMDEFGKELIMAGGTGEAGKTMLARGHKIPVGKGLVGLAAETKELIRVSDTSEDPDWLPNPLLPDTKSEIAVPIMLGDRVLGVLDVQQNIKDGLREEDSDLLQSIAYQVAAAVRNAQVFSETQQQAERETLINEIGRKIQNTASVEQALQVAARELGQALGARDSRAIIDLQSSVITKAN